MTWKDQKPASGIPAGGDGLHGPATGTGSRAAFTAENQPDPLAKIAGHDVRRDFRARLAEKLDAVEKVYDDALKDKDNRVRLVAAKQLSVELWGQPTQPLSGDDEKGPLTVVIRRFTDAPDAGE
jgi:hypothetical protein